MPNRKKITLAKKFRGLLTPDKEKNFVFGCIFFEEYTNGGKTVISKEKAASLSDVAIELIINCIFLSNLDLEQDKVASETLSCLLDEMEIRYPTPKEEVEESLRQFKEKHKEYFNEW